MRRMNSVLEAFATRPPAGTGLVLDVVWFFEDEDLSTKLDRRPMESILPLLLPRSL